MTVTTISTYNQEALDKQAAALFDDVMLRPMSLEQRLLYFSERFLSREYVMGALGEGESGLFDQNPLFRFDAFDCLTYVNTVLALALSHNLVEFKHTLLKLSYYDAEPTYLKRFHFMSLDWNVQNQRSHLLKEVTRSFVDDQGRAFYETEIADIDKSAWLQKRGVNDLKFLPAQQIDAHRRLEQLHQAASQFSSQQVSIDYLPLCRLLTPEGSLHPWIIDQLPNAAIIEIVRPGWDLSHTLGTRLHVSHLGFIFHTSEGLRFRHASSEHQHVVDVPLDDYLHRRIQSPTIKGINVFVCP